MAERKSPVKEAEKCSVKGCGNDADRSVSIELAIEAGLDVDEDLRRAHLCKEHYKAYKKGSKEDRTIGSLGH
jgi:hypothetical protein